MTAARAEAYEAQDEVSGLPTGIKLELQPRLLSIAEVVQRIRRRFSREVDELARMPGFE